LANLQLIFYRELVNIKVKIAALNIFRYKYIKIMDKLKRNHVIWFLNVTHLTSYILNFVINSLHNLIYIFYNIITFFFSHFAKIKYL